MSHLLYILIFWTFPLTCAASVNFNETQFVKVGEVVQVTGHAHLHLKLNLKGLCEQQQHLLETVTQVRSNLTASVSLRHHSKLNATFDRMEDEIHRVDNVLVMANSFFHNVKRSVIGLVSGALSFGLSLYSLAELHALQEKVESMQQSNDLIVMSLEETNNALHRTAMNIETLRNATKTLTEEYAYMSESVKIMKTVSSLKHTISMHDQFYYGIQRMLRSLLTGSLDPELLDLEQIMQMFTELEEVANNRGYSLASSDLSTLFESNLSWLVKGPFVHIFIHLPLKMSNPLSLYKYLQLPTNWFSFPVIIVPRNRKPFLVFDETRLVGTDMSQTDLEACKRIKGRYFCDNINLLRRDIGKFCTGALLLKQLSEVKRECEILFQRENTEHVSSLNQSHILVYSTHKEKTHKKCFGDSVPTIEELNEGENIIHVQEGCTLATRDFFYVPDTEISSAEGIPIETPQSVNVNDFLEEADVKEEEVLEHLKDMKYLDLTPLDNVVRHLKKIREDNRKSLVNYGHAVITFIALVLISVLVIYLIVIRRRYQKKCENSTG